MTIKELLDSACLNYAGLMRNSPYKHRRCVQYYRCRTFSELSPSMQRVFVTLLNNLRLLYEGRTYFTPYEGLRKCQVKVHGSRFLSSAPLNEGELRHHSNVCKLAGLPSIKYVLDMVEAFVSEK